ncbi:MULTISPECIES: acyl-CoA dehydrogenase family protein [Bacillaceae]|uniref:acyl-CoA dehydrogenase family protein n=1 Tax=Alteribacter populi TaxID=2011011 RepID=UPI001E5FD6DD|nr:acyl-CoA dehydrogenase family protein [Alteribacter populi]
MDELALHSLSHETSVDLFTPEDFSDEDHLISKTTELYVNQEVVPQLQSLEQHNYGIARKLFEKAGELGLLGIEVPEACGGLSLNKKISGLVAEKMGYGGSFGVAFNIHAGVGTLPYVYFGTEEQKQKYLSKLSSGVWIGAYALTESNAGSDALNPKTSAVQNDEGTAWVLNGEKQWITNAHIADVYVVFAKTAKGMTAFIVERTFQGVSIGSEEKKMGIKGSSTATLILEDVLIPNENVLGEVGEGHHIALNILNMARLKLAFANIGSAKQALQLSVKYAKERKQFKKPIADFTIIQEKIANMTTSIYGAESATYRTAGVLDEVIQLADNGDNINKKIANYAMECAINKVKCSEVLGRVVDEAVQIHGGYGYMEENEVERLYRDARISRIFEGTNEINRLTIAKSLLKKFRQSRFTTTDMTSETNSDRNGQYIQLSKQLLNQSLKAFSVSGLKVEKEQELLRILADTMSDLYVMESSYLRTEKAKAKNGPEKEKIKQLMTNVLCEEGFRRVEKAVISFISGIVSNEEDKKSLLNEVRHLHIPLYNNLFSYKREIAKEITDRAR